ncbi:MAG: hypothetical protein J6K95_04265 [Rikenellaceae bacterium]|nr:hypothetical protein [Rikenellaceae bacterium]
MEKMVIDAHVERGRDGLFCVYSNTIYVDKYCFGGYGHSAREAMDDFRVSVDSTARRFEEEKGRPAEGLADAVIEWHFDVPSFFDAHPYLNATQVAREAGMNSSQLRHYLCGVAVPRPRTVAKIKEIIGRLAAEMREARIE